MKKMLLVALMLMVAGTAAYAAMPAKARGMQRAREKRWVKTVDACKAQGGTVVKQMKNKGQRKGLR